MADEPAECSIIPSVRAPEGPIGHASRRSSRVRAPWKRIEKRFSVGRRLLLAMLAVTWAIAICAGLRLAHGASPAWEGMLR